MKSRIKQLREKELALTQKEFADSIGMTRSNVCNIESGAVNLIEKNAKLICEKYNVNMDWILYGTGDIFKKRSEDDELALLIGEFIAEDDPYKKKIIKTMLSFADEDWILIQRLIEKFKD
jgi:transcriptional regulator with XRE-family HTH domain